MAKQLVGPLERHVEKAIVGIAGLILIAVIAKYVVTAPNQLEVGGELVDPATVDKKVADKAAEVRDRIANHDPEDETPELLYGEFVKSLDPYPSNQLALEAPRGVVFGPAVPIIDPPEAIKGQKKLDREDRKMLADINKARRDEARGNVTAARASYEKVLDRLNATDRQEIAAKASRYAADATKYAADVRDPMAMFKAMRQSGVKDIDIA